MTLQFTPAQLRNVVSVPPETYRHWEKALVPLRRNCGRSPCFTFGDIVAVGVVKTLSDFLGIRVSTLSPIAVKLFEVCNSAPWSALERGKLIIDLPNSSLKFGSVYDNNLVDGLAVIVPLRPIVKQLRGQFFNDKDPNSQQRIHFPLSSVSTQKSSITTRGSE